MMYVPLSSFMSPFPVLEVVAKARPCNAFRFDAYDEAAGAGPFYARCGFREVGRVSYRGPTLIYFERLL